MPKVYTREHCEEIIKFIRDNANTIPEDQMEVNDLKLICASNIIRLRTAAGMTQAELGEKINYSDKSISKWERGEAIPDALVLVNLSELFGVSVDFILSSHDKWKSPEEKEKAEEPTYRASIVMLVAVLGVLTATVTAFVISWLLGFMEWRIFLVGISLSAVVWLIMVCIFKKKRLLKYALILLIVSLFVLAYFLFYDAKPWQLFLILPLACAVAVLSTYVRTTAGDRFRLRHKRSKNKQKT